MKLHSLLLMAVCSTLAACTTRDTRADSARVGQERADSLRALGPAGWTDDELLAYGRVVSATILYDSALVARRSSSAAVRAFGKTVTTQHRRLLGLIDSVARGRDNAIPPAVSSETFQQHELEMRRLRDAPGFDLGYVRLVTTTLAEAQDQLRRASVPDRAAGAVRLLNQAHTILASQLRTAWQLQRALVKSPARTAPRTTGTPP